MIGYFHSMFGLVVVEDDEATMRELVRKAGGDEDQWETQIVMLPRQTWHLSGRAGGSLFERGSIADEAHGSAAAIRALRDAIPERGARDSTECR